MTATIAVGGQVRWTSTKTGQVHTGKVIHEIEVDGVRRLLLPPDAAGCRWLAWEFEAQVSECATSA